MLFLYFVKSFKGHVFRKCHKFNIFTVIFEDHRLDYVNNYVSRNEFQELKFLHFIYKNMSFKNFYKSSTYVYLQVLLCSFNLLKLPEYTSKKMIAEKLSIAIHFGSQRFDFA